MKRKPMKKKDIFTKNLILGEEFTRYLVEHPEFSEKIPKGAQVILLPQNDPELADYNRKIARKHVDDGSLVVYVTIEGLAEQKSRLINPELHLKAV